VRCTTTTTDPFRRLCAACNRPPEGQGVRPSIWKCVIEDWHLCWPRTWRFGWEGDLPPSLP
jgi:hypothetical protein